MNFVPEKLQIFLGKILFEKRLDLFVIFSTRFFNKTKFINILLIL